MPRSCSPQPRHRLRRGRFLAVTAMGLTAGLGCSVSPHAASSQPTPTVTLTREQYRGLTAFRLSNQRVELLVVPELGRVVSFGPVGGPELLWTPPASNASPSGYVNAGGDRTFIGPHDVWQHAVGRMWPPDPSFDGPGVHSLVRASGNEVESVSTPWRGLGCRVRRWVRLEPDGTVVVRSRVEKTQGDAVSVAVWTVTQVRDPDSAELALDPGLPEESRVRYHSESARAQVTLQPVSVLIRPTGAEVFKVTVPSPASVLRARFGPLTLTQTADPAPRTPQDTEARALEFYRDGNPRSPNAELETLSARRTLRVGESLESVVRWNLTSEQ